MKKFLPLFLFVPLLLVYAQVLDKTSISPADVPNRLDTTQNFYVSPQEELLWFSPQGEWVVIGAGLFRSVTNLAALNAITQVRRVPGMFAFTQNDSNYWRLSSDMTNWISTVIGGVTNNIYTGDGAITGNRLVALGTNSLLFSTGNSNQIGLSSSGVGLRGRVALQTDSIITSNALVGRVFTLVDAQTGEGRWMNPNSAQPGLATVQYTWMTAAYVAGTGPPSAHAAVNNGNHSSATKLAIHQTDRGSADQKAMLMSWKKGATFTVESSGATMNYTATADPLDMGTYVEWMVAFSDSTGEPPGEAQIAITSHYEILFNSVNVAIVKSVAELQKVPTSVYAYANTQGYYDVADYGEGKYQVAPFSAGSTNWGNFQSTFDPTKMWKLIPTREGAYIRQYGCKGDGVTDDTLGFTDWMHDIAGWSGVLNPGVFMVKPYLSESNVVVSIRGLNHISLNAPVTDTNGVYLKNLSVIKRVPLFSTGNLMEVRNGTTINMSDIIFDGNKAVETANTTQMYYNVSGGPCEISSCQFRNSLGHGLDIRSTNSNGSTLNNVMVYDVRRGLRINFLNGCSLRNSVIQKCYDNNLWIYSASRILVENCYVSDGGLNGVKVDGSSDVRLVNSVIEGHKRACISIDGQNFSVNNVMINSCTIRDANCATNLDTQVVASAPGTMDTITIEGSNAANSAIYTSVVNCFIGGNAGRFGTNGPRYHFGWGAVLNPAYVPFAFWQLHNNVHKLPLVNVDYSPALTTNTLQYGIWQAK